MRAIPRLTFLSLRSTSSCQINLWIQHSFNKVSKGYFVLIGRGCYKYGNELNDWDFSGRNRWGWNTNFIKRIIILYMGLTLEEGYMYYQSKSIKTVCYC